MGQNPVSVNIFLSFGYFELACRQSFKLGPVGPESDNGQFKENSFRSTKSFSNWIVQTYGDLKYCQLA